MCCWVSNIECISLYITYIYVCNHVFNYLVAQIDSRLKLQLISSGVSLLISMRIFPKHFLWWNFTETSLISVNLISVHVCLTDQKMLLIFYLSLEAKINNLPIFWDSRLFIISLQNKWHFVIMEDDRADDEINTEGDFESECPQPSQ